MITGASDDDYVGFAIGFEPGDATNPDADYLLIDWKRVDQTTTSGTRVHAGHDRATRPRGLPRARHADRGRALGPRQSRHGAVLGTDGQRHRTRTRDDLGDTAWNRNQVYTFVFDFSPTRLDVYVDNLLEISVTGTFAVGRMGFYNFSQSGVVYSAFSISCTADSTNYGNGFPGTSGIPTLTSSLPILGTSVTVAGSNVALVETAGVLIYGFAPTDLASGFGGRLLVDGIVFESHAVPVTGMQHLLQVPPDPGCLRPEPVSASWSIDAGAASWIAFSPGLRLVLGA